jgi:hypothetical protein
LILFSGSQEEIQNVKSLQTTDVKWWLKLTWPFGLGELPFVYLISWQSPIYTQNIHKCRVCSLFFYVLYSVVVRWCWCFYTYKQGNTNDICFTKQVFSLLFV